MKKARRATDNDPFVPVETIPIPDRESATAATVVCLIVNVVVVVVVVVQDLF